jgi:hypothetical protein
MSVHRPCSELTLPFERATPRARRSADPQGALPTRFGEVLLEPDHVKSGIGVVNLGRIERCGSGVRLHSESPTNFHEGSWGFVRRCPKDRQQLHLILEVPHVVDHLRSLGPFGRIHVGRGSELRALAVLEADQGDFARVRRWPWRFQIRHRNRDSVRRAPGVTAE